MSFRATLEPNKGSFDQRGTPRKTLRLLTSLKGAGRKGTPVLVHDLSAGGMLIESDESLAIGETLAVELPRAGQREATVVWTGDRFYGCRFAEELPSSAVSAALLRARPAAPQSPRPTADEEDFPARLTALREARGLSIEQLAERLGVSRQAVWYWETGHRLPRAAMLRRIAGQLRVGEGDLGSAAKATSAEQGDLTGWKQQIATQFGVEPGQVKILVEL
jgi:transcriptional regulator with XRE-family HTH domain